MAFKAMNVPSSCNSSPSTHSTKKIIITNSIRNCSRRGHTRSPPTTSKTRILCAPCSTARPHIAPYSPAPTRSQQQGKCQGLRHLAAPAARVQRPHPPSVSPCLPALTPRALACCQERPLSVSSLRSSPPAQNSLRHEKGLLKTLRAPWWSGHRLLLPLVLWVTRSSPPQRTK